jgi:2-dehydropantoate 2-reductase
MRILVVGAGAVGGYFGGRLVEKGADVTFLVRPKRREQIEREGFVIRSVHGNANLQVQTITAGEQAKPFDLILLATKAYHLENAISNLKPYVGEQTTILPLLNGISHFERLFAEFGKEKVIGGLCFIEATLNKKGHIEHYSPRHDLVYGEFSGQITERIKKIEALFAGANMITTVSDHIHRDLWHKYIFISAMSGMTTLMQATVGEILSATHGEETYRRLLEEIVLIAKTQEPAIDDNIVEKIMEAVKSIPPTTKSSMQRDREKGLPLETEHFHGTLLKLAPEGADLPILKTVYTALSLYQPTSQ